MERKCEFCGGRSPQKEMTTKGSGLLFKKFWHPACIAAKATAEHADKKRD